MTRRITLLAIVLGVLSAPALARRGSDGSLPGAIARRCIHTMGRVAGMTVRRMHVRTNRCVRTIAELLEAGEEDRAAEVAALCVETVNQMAERGTMAIRRIAGHCIAALRELEAPEELMMAVREAAERSRNMIAQRREREIQRIEEALNGSPDTPTDVVKD